MAIASLLGPNPLKWKQTSPILLSQVRRPPFSTNPITLISAESFNNKQASADFSVKLINRRFLSSSAEVKKSRISCSSSSFSSSPPLGRVGGSCTLYAYGFKPVEIFVGTCLIAIFLVGFVNDITAAGKYIRLPFPVLLATLLGYWAYQASTTSVVKLQVGFLGTGRTLQRNLNQIAGDVRTSSSEDLRIVLTDTTVALRRHYEHYCAGYSIVTPKFGSRNAEVYFNQLSWEERVIFEEETFVNVNNRKTQNSASQRTNGFQNQYIVVTILLAIDGKYTLPSINSSADLNEALQKLSSVDKVRAVEVLWTPQNEATTLLEEQLLKIYPNLKHF